MPSGRRAFGIGAVLALVVALALLVTWAVWPVPAVKVVAAESGRVLARLPVADGEPLRLSYVHSIYRQPASEYFRVEPDGFTLTELRSPSEAVLEYYARPEPVTADGAGLVIRLAPERFATLPVLASATGERTVHYAGQSLPLHRLAGDGARVVLRVAAVPRLMLRLPILAQG